MDGAFLTEPHMNLETRAALAPGSELDRFLVRRRLGRGSHGDVYLAHDAVVGQDVAIKIVDIGTGDPNLARQLQRERVLSDKVQDHRHVLRVHDLYRVAWGGTHLLILSMEHGNGGTLRKWLRRHHADVAKRRERASELLRQVCMGLAAIHEAGILHLDLKPSNVLFVKGVLKVADFGISRALGCPSCGLGNEVADTVGLGTRAYMSPAGLSVGPLDASRDIYSLGAIFYEMVSPSCRPPFADDQLGPQSLSTGFPPPDLEDLPQKESEILRRCLSSSPDEQYRSVRDLLAALEDGPNRSRGTMGKGEAAVDDLWQIACQCVRARQFGQADTACQEILALAPDHIQAAAVLRDIRERHQRAGTVYTAIEKGLEAEGLDLLVGLLNEAVSTYPDHPSGEIVQARLAAKARRYRQAMQEGLAAVRHNDWEGARSWFMRARELNVGASVAEGAVRLVETIMGNVLRIRGLIDRAIAVGDRGQAMSLARNVDAYLMRMSRRVLAQGDQVQ
jgi:hypothetical protein